MTEWKGGERYGDTHNVWLAEYRATVTGTKPGDSVKVWFTGVKPGAGPVTSESFTYRVAENIGGRVLILAAEDVTGISPSQGVMSAKYAGSFRTALSAAGYSSDTYDVDVRGRTAPHPLGVLSHYSAIVWESGDDIVPRAPGQKLGTADDLTLQLELAVRDYLNEGGKALVTGKTTGTPRPTTARSGTTHSSPPAVLRPRRTRACHCSMTSNSTGSAPKSTSVTAGPVRTGRSPSRAQPASSPDSTRPSTAPTHLATKTIRRRC